MHSREVPTLNNSSLRSCGVIVMAIAGDCTSLLLVSWGSHILTAIKDRKKVDDKAKRESNQHDRSLHQD